ncbi:Mannosyl-oligosaccharide 1,2-alpha-mannosidase MNS3, partial [Linum grandiflorum]
LITAVAVLSNPILQPAQSTATASLPNHCCRRFSIKSAAPLSTHIAIINPNPTTYSPYPFTNHNHLTMETNPSDTTEPPATPTLPIPLTRKPLLFSSATTPPIKPASTNTGAIIPNPTSTLPNHYGIWETSTMLFWSLKPGLTCLVRPVKPGKVQPRLEAATAEGADCRVVKREASNLHFCRVNVIFSFDLKNKKSKTQKVFLPRYFLTVVAEHSISFPPIDLPSSQDLSSESCLVISRPRHPAPAALPEDINAKLETLAVSSMSKSLPYSVKDLNYDNAKFRQRSVTKVLTQSLLTKNMRRDCASFSTGKFLALLVIFGFGYLMLTHSSTAHSVSVRLADKLSVSGEAKNITGDNARFGGIWRKPPRLPPRLPPDEKASHNDSATHEAAKLNLDPIWVDRQQKVKEAFIYAWSGYRKYAMGYDELMPLSQRGTDGLGGLGATIVDALDTAMLMGADDIVSEAGSWVEAHLSDLIKKKGQVNLFETTIRVLGGLLSAYHLSGGEKGANSMGKGPNPVVYLDTAKDLADRLLLAFTSSPTPIPFSDVILHDPSAHRAPDGLSSTSEVSTLQLEFNYLSALSGDPKYSMVAMKVLEHMQGLQKVDGLVPIYISPDSGQFSGENIRLGSRGDSYYEYLIKVWLQQGRNRDSKFTYLHDMYTEAMKGVRHRLVKKSIPNGLVFVGELPYGPNGAFSPKMDHLVCFLPGTLALGATKGFTKRKATNENLMTFEDLENLKLAEDLAKTCFEMYSVTSTGLAPEIVYFHTEEYSEDGLDGGNKSSEYIEDIIIKPLDRHNLLRPETVESLFVLYRITEDPKYREWGWQIFEAFEKYTKVDSGGYSSLDDVTNLPPRRRDKMETFFLGETLKYLYLLFGDSSVIPLDKFVFNTEAHPFPIRGM